MPVATKAGDEEVGINFLKQNDDISSVEERNNVSSQNKALSMAK